MIKSVITSILGTRHDRERKRLQPIIRAIHEHEAQLGTVSEDAPRYAKGGLRAKSRALPGTQILSFHDCLALVSAPCLRSRICIAVSG